MCPRWQARIPVPKSGMCQSRRPRIVNETVISSVMYRSCFPLGNPPYGPRCLSIMNQSTVCVFPSFLQICLVISAPLFSRRPGSSGGITLQSDGLCSVDFPEAGDRRASRLWVRSIRVGISSECEKRPRMLCGVEGLGVKVCRMCV